MTPDEITSIVLDALTSIAPETNPDSIQPNVNLRDQLDLDSVDFLNFVVALHNRLGITVPEVDYPKLTTLEGARSYLHARLR